MAVRFTILGSGSKGNCAYLEAGETRLLIDAGFSAKQIRSRLATLGRAPEGLTGVLVTHEHMDHIGGLGTLCSQTGTRIYANRLTVEAIQVKFPTARLEFSLFETGSTFQVGEVEVKSFNVPHDAMDPVGFLLRTTAGTIGFLTDLGHSTRLVVERMREANLLVLESNYDEQMLQQDTDRPPSIKQRIRSRHGHLSNTAAAGVAVEVAWPLLSQIFLGHLSQGCNSPELARSTVEAALTEAGITHIRVRNTSQDTPCETVCLGD
jgi:phosphoribosyl 1,2-cyclic phosphodiesterase